MRVKRVDTSDTLLQQWITQGNETPAMVCTEGLPEGAEFVSSGYEGPLGAGIVYLVFRHDSFEDVPPGEDLPRQRVTIAKREYLDRNAE